MVGAGKTFKLGAYRYIHRNGKRVAPEATGVATSSEMIHGAQVDIEISRQPITQTLAEVVY